jgi:hypothetical protein
MTKATAHPSPVRRPPTRELLQLLGDLERQLPETTGAMRRRTQQAILRLEWELAPGRGRERQVVNDR